MRAYFQNQIKDEHLRRSITDCVFVNIEPHNITLRNLNVIASRINTILNSKFIKNVSSYTGAYMDSGFEKPVRFYYEIFVSVIIWQETGLFNIDEFLIEEDFSRLIKLYNSVDNGSQLKILIDEKINDDSEFTLESNYSIEWTFKNIFYRLKSYPETYSFLKEYL